ncbi:MAG: amidohydrolase family protein [Chitinispirillaceae bacterium]|nr:amidohydrolase family protein [Chitinispirillaceae bacterium]
MDFHTHCFPDHLAARAIEHVLATSPGAKKWTDGTMSGLRRSMAAAGITQAVVLPVATKASQVTPINRGAPLLAADDIIPFGTLHPKTETVIEEVAFLKQSTIRGIKLHPEFQDFYMDDPAVFPIYDALSEAGLILVFHAGTDPGPFSNDHSLPHRLLAVHKAFPRLTIVASHMGGHQVWDQVEELLVGVPVYFETSTAPENFAREPFVRMCRRHGMDRVLFGSDSPWFDQAYDRQWIARSGLTDQELEMVFFDNGAALLGLKR